MRNPLMLNMTEQEETSVQSDAIEPILAEMEDKDIICHLRRCKNYVALSKIMAQDHNILSKNETVSRILKFCVSDMNNDLQYSTNALLIIGNILKKIKEGKCNYPPLSLVESAHTILKLMQKVLLKPLLRKNCTDTFLLYPDETLRKLLALHSTDVIQLIDFSRNPPRKSMQGFYYEVTEKVVAIINRFFEILSDTEKEGFVRLHIGIWFSTVIPAIVAGAVENPMSLKNNINTLEELTRLLKPINYSENPDWNGLLLNICNKERYPSILKSLLESDAADYWHRLWMVFITLLKEQITKICNGISPINAMLVVVETAFKKNVNYRIQAFECWNCLIDNLSKEQNEPLVHKRLKLLLTPLILNNAKVEGVVIAKLNTWWHLIRRYHSKMDKLTDTVLMPFLNFCFNNKHADGKALLNPIDMSDVVSKRCVEVLVEIVGHVDCDGCCSLPIPERLITRKLLVDHWALWMHILRCTFKSAARYIDPDDSKSFQQLTCLWKGFIMVVAEFPENQIRADLCIELLKLVDSLVEPILQVCKDSKQNVIIWDILLKSLITNDPKVRPLLKSKTARSSQGALHMIMQIVQSTALQQYKQLRDAYMEGKLNLLNQITDLMLDPTLTDPDDMIECLLKRVLPTNVGLLLWAAMADSICEYQHPLKQSSLHNMVLGPFRSQQVNTDIFWYNWYCLYSYVHQITNCEDLDKEVEKMLTGNSRLIPKNTTLHLCAAVALLKQTLLTDRTPSCEATAKLVTDALTDWQEYTLKNMDSFCPILTDTLFLLLINIAETINLNLAKSTCFIIQKVSPLIHNGCIGPKPIYLETLQNGVKEGLQKLNKIDAYASLKPIIATTLDSLNGCTNTDSAAVNISINTIEGENPDKNEEIITAQPIEQQKDSNSNNFSIPKTNIAKKPKTKVPNVVKKVVENGEEYEVIKSNWKFNPKKLTENQKEKFTRKREDIPALYQDLSQSQDEFKMTTWKTDSQDASTTTSSKSESNSKPANDNLAILQALQSTEVVPQIIENILTDATKKNTDKLTENVDSGNNIKLTPLVKKTYSPRLALKDRVFRNVRNLIEKSGLQGDGKSTNQVIVDMNQTIISSENHLQTPVAKTKDAPVAISSAPPKICSERPIRSIKKPKKFEDGEVFSLRKRRRSQGSCQTSDIEQDLEKDQELAKKSATKEIDSMVEQEKVNNAAPDQPKQPEISEKLIPSSDKAAPSPLENIQVIPKQDDNKKKIDKTAIVSDEMEVEVCNIQNDSKEQPANANDNNHSQNIEQLSTPKSKKLKKKEEQSSIKNKTSRIEKQLLIDMVEGHPVLQQTQSEKRITRKKLNNVSRRRKSLMEKNLIFPGIIEDQAKDKSKPGTVSIRRKQQKTEISSIEQNSQTVTIIDSHSQEQLSQSQEDIPMSEDIIESSQDSTLTTISVKSTSKKKIPLVNLKTNNTLSNCMASDTQKLLDEFNNEVIPLLNDSSGDSREVLQSPDTIVVSSSKEKIPSVSSDDEHPLAKCKNDKMSEKVVPLDITSNNSTGDSREDIELPKNKTMHEDISEENLTENMDTEPLDSSGEVIIINEKVETPIVINTEDTIVGKETQEIAEADTLPLETTQSECNAGSNISLHSNTDSEMPPTLAVNVAIEIVAEEVNTIESDKDITNVTTQEDLTPTTHETVQLKADAINDIIAESSNTGSPFKDEVQRKNDFLNNTIEISPIKSLSPVREEKSLSPESSSDYVVIKLTSPVQSNGEPYSEKCDSPEIFTDDKVSPDKRDQSPPRKVAAAASSSPSSALSLKKNRPQMRFNNNRAAQMLGLCAPENLPLIFNSEKSENDDSRKSTPAKRNLKRVYNSGDKSENVDNESGESEALLKFLQLTSRAVPTADCSPSNPILKRKLSEITDDATISPASKRKRVSFHDPPVSTTVAVEKYIEPCIIRSPSNSSLKRQERQARTITNAKSSKRLDNMFKLDTFLTKAVESFSDDTATIGNETEMSLDETPAAEIVKTSELNDADPICPELLNCKDPIQIIAAQLSSESTKSWLVKELEGKVETISDLAKMTELEVNRLCIKAPKVKVVRKVLTKYALGKAKLQESATTTEVNTIELPKSVEIEKVNMEVQTNEVLTNDSEMQTAEVTTVLVCTQTETLPTAHSTAQTNETGSMPTRDVIHMCLNERPDFVDQLSEQLVTPAISEKLPDDVCVSLLLNKMNTSNSTEILKKILTDSKCTNKEELQVLQDHLRERFGSKELMSLCIQLLQYVHENQ